MENNKSFFSAFSLIELSIVILIIGTLIAGVTQGSRLVRISKLRTAQNQTSTSPVSSIDGLALWLDAVDEINIAVGNTILKFYFHKVL